MSKDEYDERRLQVINKCTSAAADTEPDTGTVRAGHPAFTEKLELQVQVRVCDLFASWWFVRVLCTVFASFTCVLCVLLCVGSCPFC
jgi:hypothetical protein